MSVPFESGESSFLISRNSGREACEGNLSLFSSTLESPLKTDISNTSNVSDIDSNESHDTEALDICVTPPHTCLDGRIPPSKDIDHQDVSQVLKEIISNIWGDTFVGDRTIAVHIRKVREKIGAHHIKTIKGVGYKFDI